MPRAFCMVCTTYYLRMSTVPYMTSSNPFYDLLLESVSWPKCSAGTSKTTLQSEAGGHKRARPTQRVCFGAAFPLFRNTPQTHVIDRDVSRGQTHTRWVHSHEKFELKISARRRRKMEPCAEKIFRRT